MARRRELFGNNYMMKIIPSGCKSEFLLLLLCFFFQLLVWIFDFVSLTVPTESAKFDGYTKPFHSHCSCMCIDSIFKHLKLSEQ